MLAEAADGNRTRVTHLGKVVRNHYATAACLVCERRDSNPHTEVLDPKSSVYTSFTTLARFELSRKGIEPLTHRLRVCCSTS